MENRIRAEIDRFVAGSSGNRHSASDMPYFDPPLVGFASVDDPIFLRIKAVIGDFHLTPGEFLERRFGAAVSGGTVISWVLPVSGRARTANRKEERRPSPEWARVRTHGEEFNNALRRRVVSFLDACGHRAASPLLSGEWKQFRSTPVGIASSWSERHAAYAAGLGTFGLSDGLITEKGMAHRCGSVVTDLRLSPTPRRYLRHDEYCLFFREGSCGECIARCPAGAISPGGHDKEKCFLYCSETVPALAADRYDVKVLGCGLCQTGVPCEDRVP
jgi:epoxyqueuosine reductase QueG